MNYLDDPFGRDLKRIEVARRMVLHQARTQAIVTYTCLTRNRLATLRRRWRVPDESRRRGPSPRSLAAFLRTPNERSEAAAIVSLCVALEALPGQYSSSAVPALPRLEIADRLCEAFEAFRTWLPNSTIEFEELLLLANELATGSLIKLSTCRGCKGAILVFRHDIPRGTCPHCDRRAAIALHTGASMSSNASIRLQTGVNE
jgi:hypothetical protein